MSNIALSNVEEVLERSLFQRLLDECIAKGYSPNVQNATLYPNSAVGFTALEAAYNTIVASKGYSIEVFNFAKGDARVRKKVPRIVIQTQSVMEGSLGGDSSRIYTLDNVTNKYYAETLPPQTSDFIVDIHLIAETAIQMRVLNALLALAIPRRGFIPFYNDSAHKFFTLYLSYLEIQDKEVGLIEKVYRYKIPDLFETNRDMVATGIPKLTQVTVTPSVTP